MVFRATLVSCLSFSLLIGATPEESEQKFNDFIYGKLIQLVLRPENGIVKGIESGTRKETCRYQISTCMLY